ncbi:hypothetical protein NHQ30_011573 [Ciborinia camelliae]|nr:hypothetical protein NHQ30_011573 [Ciborinia camelliae]
MSEEEFKYTNLDPEKPGSIRLLVLHADNPGSIIRCSLIHTTLRECRTDIYHPYTALSYVWGNSGARKDILLNGKRFSVTTNLAAALEDLRHHKDDFRLWADAICINQASNSERNKQRNPLAWSPQDSAIFQYQMQMPDPVDFKEIVPDPLELLRGMNEARLKYQKHLVTGRDWATLLSILIARRGAGASDPKDIIYGHLGIVGVDSSHLTQSESRDKYYLETWDCYVSIPDLPIVDYTKSIDEIFIDAARHIAVASTAFSESQLTFWEFLHQCEVKNPAARRSNLPTWVPDWILNKDNLPDAHWLDVEHKHKNEARMSTSCLDLHILDHAVDQLVLPFHCSLSFNNWGPEPKLDSILAGIFQPKLLSNNWDEVSQRANDLLREYCNDSTATSLSRRDIVAKRKRHICIAQAI